MNTFHCRVCGKNINWDGKSPVFGDGVCGDCELKQSGICKECASGGRAVKVEDCTFHHLSQLQAL